MFFSTGLVSTKGCKALLASLAVPDFIFFIWPVACNSRVYSVFSASFRPSPFFILDKVDAGLDKLNMVGVASFIRSKSCGGVGLENSNVDFRFVFRREEDTRPYLFLARDRND